MWTRRVEKVLAITGLLTFFVMSWFLITLPLIIQDRIKDSPLLMLAILGLIVVMIYGVYQTSRVIGFSGGVASTFAICVIAFGIASRLLYPLVLVANVESFFINLVTEAISIFLTVVIINKLDSAENERRQFRTEQEIRQLNIRMAKIQEYLMRNEDVTNGYGVDDTEYDLH